MDPLDTGCIIKCELKVVNYCIYSSLERNEHCSDWVTWCAIQSGHTTFVSYNCTRGQHGGEWTIAVHTDVWSRNVPLWAVEQVQLNLSEFDRPTKVEAYFNECSSIPVESEESSCPVIFSNQRGR